jgi:hypothetical protein
MLPILSEKEEAAAKSIFVSGNDVYVCGYSKYKSGTGTYSSRYTACYWKNGEVMPLLSLDPAKYNSEAVSIFVSGNDVYIGGYSYGNSYADSRSSVAGYWKNGKWIAFTSVDDDYKLTSIFVFGKDIYASGYSGYTNPGYWKNGEWVGFNEKGGYPPVTSIVVVPRPTGE